MRVAVISDIHANLPALEAVAEAIAAEPVDALWCLGDLVGYGAQPNECCRWAMEHADVCLAGNHDLAAPFAERLPGANVHAVPSTDVDGWRFVFLDSNALGREVHDDGTVHDRDERVHRAHSGELLPDESDV